jgi:hypothetical protein
VFLFRGGFLLVIACTLAALIPGMRWMAGALAAEEGRAVSVGGAAAAGKLPGLPGEDDDQPVRTGWAMASPLRQSHCDGQSATEGYGELFAPDPAAPPSGRGQRLARCGSPITFARARQDLASSRIACTSERPVCYAAALLSQTP